MNQNAFSHHNLSRDMYSRENDIINPKYENSTYVTNMAYPKGTVNPVEKKTTTKIINIDSLFRDNYESTSASNFTWNLPEPVKNVIAMKVVAMELPNVWYSISSKLNNNQFYIYLYNVRDSTDTTSGYHDEVHTITIPDGNYMAPNFMNSLNNYLTNMPTAVDNKFNGLHFLCVDVSPFTTKTTIRTFVSSESGNCPYNLTDPYYSPNFYFEIDFNTSDETDHNAFKKTLGWFLGFRKSTYIVTSENQFIDNISDSTGSVTYKYCLQSESSYGSTIQNYIYIDLNDFNRNESTDTISAPTENGYIGNNVMARISVSTLFNSTLFDNASDRVYKQRDYYGPVRISKMQIKLLNKFGDVIDLIGNDFSMALELTVLYSL